jgi:hypothetical protein
MRRQFHEGERQPGLRPEQREVFLNILSLGELSAGFSCMKDPSRSHKEQKAAKLNLVHPQTLGGKKVVLLRTICFLGSFFNIHKEAMTNSVDE